MYTGLWRHRFSPAMLRAGLLVQAFGLALILAVWAAVFAQMAFDRNSVVDQATAATRSAAAAFSDQTSRTLKNIDSLLLRAKYDFETTGKVDLKATLATSLLVADYIDSVTLVNSNGAAVASTRAVGALNVADREYFQTLRHHDTDRMEISQPVTGRVTGLTSIILSRRLNARDGSFAGILFMAVRPAYFTNYSQAYQLGKRGALSVVGADGVYRARQVGSDAVATPVGSTALTFSRDDSVREGSYQSRSSIDSVERLVSYRKLTDYPLVVAVGEDLDDALAGYRGRRAIYLSIAVVASAAILSFFGVLMLLAIRLQASKTRVRAQSRFLQTLVDHVPAGITVRSMLPANRGQFTLWNESNTLLFGKPAHEPLGRTVHEVLSAEDAQWTDQLDGELLASPMVQEVTRDFTLPDQSMRTFHIIRAPIFSATGVVEHILTSAYDVTHERDRTDQLRLASKVFETTADAILISDADDRILRVNEAFFTLTGYTADEIVGKVLGESPFRPLDTAGSAQRMRQLQASNVVTGEVARRHKDGTELALWLTASCVRDERGNIVNYVRVFSDISALKDAQQKLEQLASFDSLTNLPNRRLYNDRLDHALRRAHRNGIGMAAVFIDLDDFKEVNDAYGHDVGDLLLREVAARLSHCVRSSDSVGRLGGDEFGVVMEDVRAPLDAALAGARVIAALSAPFCLASHSITIGASVGIALYPQDGIDGAALLRNADVAMYQAKHAGRNNFRFFSPADNSAAELHEQ